MTVYAQPTQTLAVEKHNGSLWLCAVEHGHSRLLARFSDEAAVEAYKRVARVRDMYMHAAGASGI